MSNKAIFRPSEKLEFHIEGAGQKELFKNLSIVQEVFSEVLDETMEEIYYSESDELIAGLMEQYLNVFMQMETSYGSLNIGEEGLVSEGALTFGEGTGEFLESIASSYTMSHRF